MAKKAIYPNIVRGGIAIPIPNRTNYYYMKGKKHKDGGIDIGENPRTGLEVEDGEILHLTDNNIKVFSSVPFLNGKSPAEKVLGGDNPDKIFKQQEDFKDKNNLNDDGTKKAWLGKKAAVIRTPEDEKVSKLTRSYYKEVNPLAGYPGVIDAIAHGLNVFGRRYIETDSTAYPVTDKVADATWRKRLGLSYNEADLPSNNDGSVRLPKDRELEIPIDTNLLKKRINANQKLSKKYEDANKLKSKEIVDWAIGEDQAALDALRTTYKTGKPVVVNEQAYNSRSLVNDGKISMPGSSPLNPLQNYTLQYDKDRNVMMYKDIYDFNHLDWAVPGKGYKIQGEINLNKKLMGGEKNTYHGIPESNRRVLRGIYMRRGAPGDKEALLKLGYDKYGRDLAKSNGGRFSGAGAGSSFSSENNNTESNDYVRNTPILRSFGDAFAEARQKGLSTFIFNGKEYNTEKSNNPNYIGKRYEPALNIREVLDENKKVISDSTRVEPYLGQIPGTHKRTKKEMGGKINKPFIITVNGKTKVVYSPSTGRTRSEAEGIRNKALLGEERKLIENYHTRRHIEDDWNIPELNYNILTPITSNKVNRRLSYYTPDLLPEIKHDMKNPVITQNKINPIKPITTVKTNNIGEFINNNKNLINDGISLTGNIIGSLLSHHTNRRALNKMKSPSIPISQQVTKLKTKININPQLDKMRETVAAYERNIDANTASSKAALSRKRAIRSEMLSNYNTLFGEKENKETSLINQDRLNRQGITNQNIKDYNAYLDKKVAFENALIDKKAENDISLISNINAAAQNIINVNEQRRKDRNNLISIIAAYPNVNPQMLKNLGFDGITQEMINKINKNRKG